MTKNSKKRLGLARNPGDLLWKVAVEASWEPTSIKVTEIEALRPFEAPPSTENEPEKRFDAAIILSPAGAKMAQLPEQLPCLVTGEATGIALGFGKDRIMVSPTPKAEGIWDLLQDKFPHGGNFILIRGEQSRGFLERVAEESPWRLHPVITHREVPATPLPNLEGLDAVLALSPLQAKILAPLSGKILRFAWGERTKKAFEETGVSVSNFCESNRQALLRMLNRHA